MQRFEWDNKEVKGGYDHDADRVRHKRIRDAEHAPADTGVGLRVLGKCTACDAPAVHKWLKDGTLICAKHWTHALAKRAEDISAHPEKYLDQGMRSFYSDPGGRPARGAGPTKRRRGK